MRTSTNYFILLAALALFIAENSFGIRSRPTQCDEECQASAALLENPCKEAGGKPMKIYGNGSHYGGAGDNKFFTHASGDSGPGFTPTNPTGNGDSVGDCGGGILLVPPSSNNSNSSVCRCVKDRNNNNCEVTAVLPDSDC